MMDDTVILAIDAGNTRIKWGVHDGHAWSATGAIDTAQSGTLYEALRAALPVDAVIASNVAGAPAESAIRSLGERASIPVTFIRGEAQRLGVTNAYPNPTQLGADRWTALVAAHHARQGHKLVVNAGTALTIDALAADGRFLGGLIVPGPALMRRSLDRGTAGLRLTEGRFDEFPRSTPDAITSGAIQAGAGAIAQLRDAMARLGLAPGRAIVSGGAAGELAPHLPIECSIHENLVLDGLALIARHT